MSESTLLPRFRGSSMDVFQLRNGAYAQNLWGKGRRETPQNSSRDVGGHEVIHTKVIRLDFSPGEALIWN